MMSVLVTLTFFSASADLWINNAADLRTFRDAVNNGTTYSGQTVYLTTDINLSGESWTPIAYTPKGGTTRWFEGTFDGQGHKITNFNVDVRIKSATNQYPFGGLFGRNSGTIKNLQVEGATIYAEAESGTLNSSAAGGIAGYNTGTITYCVVKSSNITAKINYGVDGACSYAGGIAGAQKDGTISYCYVEGNTITAKKSSSWATSDTYTNALSNKWSGSNTQTECCTSTTDYTNFKNSRNNAAWSFNNIPGAAVAEPYTWEANGITPKKHYAVNVTNDFADNGSYLSAGAKIISPASEYQLVSGGKTYNLYNAGTTINFEIDVEGKGAPGYEIEYLGGYNFVKKNGYYVDKAYLTYNYFTNPSQSVEKVEISAGNANDDSAINHTTKRYYRTNTFSITSPAKATTLAYTTRCEDEFEVFVGDAKAFQLLQLTEAGKEKLSVAASYLTYNANNGGELYFVNDDAKATKLSESELAAAWEMINDANAAAYYNWSLKTWVAIELPESYIAYAKNAESATLSKVTNNAYNLNVNGEVISVAPQADGTFAYICTSQLGNNNLSVALDYATSVNADHITTNAAKELSLSLIAPKALKASQNEITFDVVADAGTTEGEIIVTDNEGKEYNVENAVYNAMSVSFSFAKPNIDASFGEKYDVVYIPTLNAGTKGKFIDNDITSSENRTFKFDNINIFDENISFGLETRYYAKGSNFDEESYIASTIGEDIYAEATLPEMEYASSDILPSVSSYIKAVPNDENVIDIYMSETKITFDQMPNIAGVELSNNYFDIDIFDIEIDEIEGLQLGSEIYDLGKVIEMPEVVSPMIVSATPVYMFVSNMRLTEITGMSSAMLTATIAKDPEYVALRGMIGVSEIEVDDDIVVGVDSALADGVSIKTGAGRIEILGAEDNQIYNVSGVLVGAGKSCYNVANGFYLVKLGNKTIKVVVK